LVQYYADADKKHMYPRSIGFINKHSTVHQINLESSFMSKDYVDAFCHGIEVDDSLRELNMRNSGLTSVSGIKIASALKKTQIKSVDFSENPALDLSFYSEIADLLMSPKLKIQEVIMEGNKMKDSNCKLLCTNLINSTSITVLNLSRNHITDHSCHYIC